FGGTVDAAAHPNQAGDGGGVHDHAAAPLLLEAADSVFAAVEDAAQVRVHNPVPVGVLVVLEGFRGAAGDAGVVVEDVEPAEGGDRRLDQRGDLGLARHVTAAGNGPTGGFAEQIQRLLAAVLADVRTDEARALAA